jgi:hypothetical protein
MQGQTDRPDFSLIGLSRLRRPDNTLSGPPRVFAVDGGEHLQELVERVPVVVEVVEQRLRRHAARAEDERAPITEGSERTGLRLRVTMTRAYRTPGIGSTGVAGPFQQ